MTAIYQVDAFASRVFKGNPAAVVPLKRWPDDTLLQSIAEENNLAETAFIVPADRQWTIRWFTPTAEVALCGHATLAAAHVIFQHLGSRDDTIEFSTRLSGTLSVSRRGERHLAMSFPAVAVTASDQTADVASALCGKPTSVWRGHYSPDQFDLLAVFDDMAEVVALRPDAAKLAHLGSRGVIATSSGGTCKSGAHTGRVPGGELSVGEPAVGGPSVDGALSGGLPVGGEYDFVSRYFAPAFGIPEDPVTGSAHCLLTPYWVARLDKTVLRACQMSSRTGELECRLTGDRVELIGHAVDYMQGTLFVDV